MAAARTDPARQQFAQRILTQLRARYPGWEFAPWGEEFAVRGSRGKAQLSLSLSSLFDRASRPGASLPEEISTFVAGVAPRLSAAERAPDRDQPLPDPAALLWCVRDRRSIEAYSRFAELARRDLPGGLLAYVAEVLPGDALRGVSRDDAVASGLEEADLVEHADRNTSLRLTRWRAVLGEAPDQQRWLFTGDFLFSSSLVLVPEFLRELAERGRGQASLAVPDRGMVVAGIDAAGGAELMVTIARRLYRLASRPLSPLLLQTNGTTLELHPGEAERGGRTGILQRLLGRAGG